MTQWVQQCLVLLELSTLLEELVHGNIINEQL